MKVVVFVWLGLLVCVLGINQRELLDTAPEIEQSEMNSQDITNSFSRKRLLSQLQEVIRNNVELVMDESTFGSIFYEEMNDWTGPDMEYLYDIDFEIVDMTSDRDLATQISSGRDEAVETFKNNVQVGEVAVVGIAIAQAAAIDADNTASIIFKTLSQELEVDDMIGPLVFSVENGSTVVSTMIANVLIQFVEKKKYYRGSELAFKLIEGNATAGKEVFQSLEGTIVERGCAYFNRLVSSALVLGEVLNIKTDVDNAIRQGSIINCIRFGPNPFPSEEILDNFGIAESSSLAQAFLDEIEKYKKIGNSAPFVSALNNAGLRYQVDDLADMFEIALEKALEDEDVMYSLTISLPELSGFAGPGVQLGLTMAMNRIRQEYGCEALGSILTDMTRKASEQNLSFQWGIAIQQEEGLSDCIRQSVRTCIGFALRDCCFPTDNMPSKCSNCGFQLGCRYVQDRSSLKEIGYFVYKDQHFSEVICECPSQA